LAIQRVTEEIVLKLAAEARRLTGAKRLCLAGGVALNCVANGKLLDKGLFEEVFVQPAAGDAGGALGAALAAYYGYFGGERVIDAQRDGMHGAYLGPAYSGGDVKKVCRVNKVDFTEYDSESAVADVVAGYLAEGKIVGWFQGRMEFGPRALGNRSILADPRDAGMQRKLNLSIKNREGFRPFAPVCAAEQAGRYLERPVYSPYMLVTRRLNAAYYKPLPDGYVHFAMKEKLAVVRSAFPAITHVDGSCRVQTVRADTNPQLWGLLAAFERLTGEGMLINTSFNVRDEPIVCSPAEAFVCFNTTAMDVLVMDNIIILKR
jgi:carbamoyltransferase